MTAAVMTTVPGTGMNPPAAQPQLAMSAPRYHSDSLALGAHPEAVPSARRRTRLVLDEWGLGDLAADTAQVVTELVENAVQATSRAGLDAPVRLTLIAGLRTVLVVVRDAVADPPVPRQPLGDDPAPWTGDDADPDPDQHGNGLIIVAALSASWDWKPRADGGKVVRALMRGQRRP